MALSEQLRAWQQLHPGPGLAVHDFDADGICAAALWKRRMEGPTQVISSRLHLPALRHPAQRVYLLDLSCPQEGLPWSQPTAVIDHHPLPARTPENCLVLHCSEHCSAWLAHDLFWAETEQHAWIAALGILSDLGDAVPCHLLQSQLEQWGLNPLRQITSLINSAHRAGGDCDQALQALLSHDSPRQLLQSRQECVTYLRQCQRKVKKRLGQARQAPVVERGQLALVQFQCDCPIQSIIAQIWKSRLPERVVLAANLRSDRPEVQLSVRSRGHLNAVELLGRLGLVVRGHPQSAGAVLTPTQWEDFLKRFYAHSH
ncbi:MAG: DHH family phosphoesterase [Vulcanimicrobiota bacterium]